MSSNSGAQSIIVRRKKIVQGAHHGGAWKVAYADFVTAMMAFFLLMWLLSSTDEEQRLGLADYFSPDIPISASASGGEGPFGGASMLSQEALLKIEGGVSESLRQAGMAERAIETDLAQVQAALIGDSGDAMAADPLLRHIRTRLTDEGLIVEVFDIEGSRLFRGDSPDPNPLLRDLLAMVGRVLAATANQVAVTGHVGPGATDAWTLSSDRAQAARRLLAEAGIAEARFARVTGKADRSPATEPARDPRNRRIEVTLLRHAAQ